MDKPVTRRGVYRDLTVSPYEFITPYGDIFKFPSQKKMDVYTRQVAIETGKVVEALVKRDVLSRLTDESLEDLERKLYIAVYEQQRSKWK